MSAAVQTLRQTKDARREEVATLLRELLARAENGEFTAALIAIQRADGGMEHVSTFVDDIPRVIGNLCLMRAACENVVLGGR